MHQGYFILDQARLGAENMAIDQALLEIAGRDQCVFLRVYSWSQPTLSLGYFQSYDERLTHQPSLQLDIVRRSTGGGAIVHHHDWTYSVCVPDSLLKSNLGAVPELYEAIHESVIAWLAKFNIHASRFNEDPACKSDGCSFLCFERRSTGDVVSGGMKLMGSAQRRKYGALLQHGSLLLQRSTYAPSLDGTKEILFGGPKAAESSSAEQDRVFDKLSASRADFGTVLVESLERFCEIRLQNEGRLSDFLQIPVNPGIFSQDSWLRRR